MSTTQDSTTLPALEEMSTEEFLVWMLTNCEIEPEDFPDIRFTVQRFSLSRLIGYCFNIQAVEEKYPFISNWLERTAP